ncbi:MAG: fibronectin type III domain-containing protein, partial [Lachnospiraceae bacterium]|nr:fibronectin type III domain-containing protein [Lachnospiraceae bacterium]
KRDYGSYFSVYAFWKDLNPPKPPASVKITQVKRTSSKKATVKWKKISGAEGYEITYSVKSSFKSAKVKTVSKNKASCVIKGLKKNKVYYVKIRAYKTDKVGRKISGAYSKVKKIKNE